MPATKTKGEALPSIKVVLDDLGRRQLQLDALDTQISNLIKRIEDALRKHISVRVCTDLHDYSVDPNPIAFTLLAFGKLDGKWQLTIETGLLNDHDTSVTVKPLLSAPREMRMRVFNDGHVEAMVRGATAQLEQQIAQRRKAIETGCALAEALDGIPF
jgi:hypothetical protein